MNALVPMEGANIPYENVSLSLPADLPQDEWLEVGRKLVGAQRNVQWLIGDWWAYGDRTYGSAKKAVEQHGIGCSVGTLYNLGTIARRFGASRRHEAVRFNVYAALTPLPSSEADEILDSAIRDGWTVRQVREEVQRRRAVEIVQQTTAPSRPFDYALRCLARLVGAFVDLDPAEFIGSSKGTQAQVNARQMVMYLLLTDADFREIDIANGLGRHHSTVDHAVEKFTALREEAEIDDALTRLGETYRLFRNTQAAAGLIAEMTA